VYLRMPNR
ncbi:helicase family protein, partial [Vibrio parahaemolyticus V-223/04]